MPVADVHAGRARPRRQVERRPLRVASVPSSHVYVRHLADPDGPDGVVRLPDPRPSHGRSVPGGWWPPVILEGPSWIDAHHRDFDLVHVHFGFDAVTVDQLQQALDALRRWRKPLVLTVHDLRNPHQSDPRPHLERLRLLIDHAAELITLTPSAAAQIDATWSRPTTVLPHPHVVPRARVGRTRPARTDLVVGVHAKSIRACMDPVTVGEALAEIVQDLPGVRLQINLHDELLDPGNHFYGPAAAERLLRLGTRPDVEVRVHPYLDDEALWSYLGEISASVLPYRFGSHSGWLEAGYDLGTAIIAPTCGFYAEQRPVSPYELTESTFDADSLAVAVRAAAMRSGAPQATWADRRLERQRLAVAHRRLYERVLS